jgi:hypothetical protein
LTLQSAELKNQPVGEYIVKAFDTQAAVPNAAGVIPSGSNVSFTLWMKRSSTFGTMFPRAKLNLNSANGTSLCTATGTNALTTTAVEYSFSCQTAAPVTMAASDRFYLWVGVNLTIGPGNKASKAQLLIEGTLNGNYDSRIVAPLPNNAPSVSITSPANNSIFVAGATVNINANASDTDGTITKVEFFQDSTKVGEDTTSPYTGTRAEPHPRRLRTEREAVWPQPSGAEPPQAVSAPARVRAAARRGPSLAQLASRSRRAAARTTVGSACQPVTIV